MLLPVGMLGQKAAVGGLAIFGGAPLFSQPVHVGRPNIGNRDRLMARITEVLDRRWLSNNGPLVQELEQRIADFVDVKHCITICNGTIALEIGIRAVGMTGEVIVPSFTFVATAHALEWQDIRPVFSDIHPGTHALDPRAVEARITERTTGIIGVHTWGEPCDIEGLSAVANSHGLKLLFDASHAFGCSHAGRMIGGFGDLEIFSFHATKFFNTFEGGAIVTNNDELAAKIRLMKNFGFAGYDKVIYPGTNGKMNEVCAAMGLTGLESIDEFIAVNRAHYLSYQRLLGDLSGVRVFPLHLTERRNYQHVVLEVGGRAGARDRLVRILHAENVLARRYFYPGCHRMEPYRSRSPGESAFLPNTDAVGERVLVLPTGTAVGEEDIEAICAVIRLVVTHAEEIEHRLPARGGSA